jgi:hypothetical protein
VVSDTFYRVGILKWHAWSISTYVPTLEGTNSVKWHAWSISTYVPTLEGTNSVKLTLSSYPETRGVLTVIPTLAWTVAMCGRGQTARNPLQWGKGLYDIDVAQALHPNAVPGER